MGKKNLNPSGNGFLATLLYFAQRYLGMPLGEAMYIEPVARLMLMLNQHCVVNNPDKTLTLWDIELMEKKNG